MLREVEIRNSSPPLNKPHLPQNSEKQPSLPVLPGPDIPVRGRLAHFCGTKRRTDRQQVGPLYRPIR